MDEDRIDAVLTALAHRGRRRMLDLIMANPGQSVSELSTAFEMSRIAVMKHLQVLETAELVTSEKRGRVRHLYVNPVPLQILLDRWTTQFSAFFSEHVADIKTRAEERARTRKDSKSA